MLCIIQKYPHPLADTDGLQNYTYQSVAAVIYYPLYRLLNFIPRIGRHTVQLVMKSFIYQLMQ